MVGLFFSPEKRVQKKKTALLERSKRLLEIRKSEFRDNAVGKLLFLYPDVQLALNMQSDEFAGYSRTKNKFIFGSFADRFLPSLFNLEESTQDANFEEKARIFNEEVRDYARPEPRMVDGEWREYSEVWFKSFLESERAKVGYSISDHQDQRAHEIRLYKNDRIVARTGKFSPKPEGYLADSVYRHVVQDLNGSGVSSLGIDIGIYTAGEVFRRRINFFYIDSPRRSESQSRDHYLQVCSQFLPFLSAMESHVTDTTDIDYIFAPSEEDIDDKVIGLSSP